MYSMSKPISLYYHWLLTPDTRNKLIPVRAPSSAAISTVLSTLSSSMKTTFVYGWVRLRCSYSNTHRFIRVVFVGGLSGYWSCVQHTSCSRAASSVCPEPRMLHSSTLVAVSLETSLVQWEVYCLNRKWSPRIDLTFTLVDRHSSFCVTF